MNLDIATTVRVIFVLSLIASITILFNAWITFQEAHNIRYYIKRRRSLRWVYMLVGIGLLVGILSFLINQYSEPIIYKYFPPSPTPPATATVTLTPTITSTPTITLTPTLTATPLYTPTPIMPVVISGGFTSSITPNPNAIFSPITFSRKLAKNLLPLQSEKVFRNPITSIFGSFSYDRMIPGVQWTALWFRNGELIFFESLPWNGASGGYGFTECKLPAQDWLPGRYEVRIYVGETWKVTSNFDVIGNPLTPTFTPTLRPTKTLIPTKTMTSTPIKKLEITAIITFINTPIPTSTEDITP